MQFKLSRYALDIPLPGYAARPEADRLLFSRRTGKIVRLSSQYLDLLYGGGFERLPDRLFAMLLDHELLAPVEEDETSMLLTRRALEMEDRRRSCVAIRVDTSGARSGEEFAGIVVRRVLEALAGSAAGGKRQVRLLVIGDGLEMSWLELLDEGLGKMGGGPKPGGSSGSRPGGPEKLSFSLCLLFQESVAGWPSLPLLKTLQPASLIFVQRAESIVLAGEGTAPLAGLRDFLGAPECWGRVKVQLVIGWTGRSWEQWSDDYIALLALVARDRRVTVEFTAEGGSAEEAELLLMRFLASRGIRCKWLPVVRRLCSGGLTGQDGSGGEDSFELEKQWDGDEIVRLSLQSGFAGNLAARVLATSGLAV